MENPVIKGYGPFQTVFPFWDIAWESSFQKAVTSGHAGRVGDGIGKNEMKMGWKLSFSVQCRQARNEASCIENWRLHYTKGGWRKPNLTAVHVKTTQECKLTTRLIGASSATLPFSKANAVLGCGQTTTGIFLPSFGYKMLRGLPTKWRRGY